MRLVSFHNGRADLPRLALAEAFRIWRNGALRKAAFSIPGQLWQVPAHQCPEIVDIVILVST